MSAAGNGRHPRNAKPQMKKRDATHKWYECQFVDCPKRSKLMKISARATGRPPTYHPDCKAKLKEIRVARDGSADGRPAIGADGRDSLQPITPADRARINMPICGAQRRGRVEGICCMPQGWGTAHPGSGHCKLHGGNTPSGNVSAIKEQMFKEVAVMGAPIEIDPHSAVLQEIHRTAGHVEWLRMMIGAMGVDPQSQMAEVIEDEMGVEPRGATKSLTQFTEKGVAPSVWIDMYQKERSHLVRTCKMAVDMGCAERSVRLAEDQGRLIATVMSKIFNDPKLALTNVQKAELGPIVRRELMALESESQSTKNEKTA